MSSSPLAPPSAQRLASATTYWVLLRSHRSNKARRQSHFMGMRGVLKLQLDHKTNAQASRCPPSISHNVVKNIFKVPCEFWYPFSFTKIFFLRLQLWWNLRWKQWNNNLFKTGRKYFLSHQLKVQQIAKFPTTKIEKKICKKQLPKTFSVPML